MSVIKNSTSFKEAWQSQNDSMTYGREWHLGLPPGHYLVIGHRSCLRSFVWPVGLRAQKCLDSAVTSDSDRLAGERKVDFRAHSFPERSDL